MPKGFDYEEMERIAEDYEEEREEDYEEAEEEELEREAEEERAKQAAADKDQEAAGKKAAPAAPAATKGGSSDYDYDYDESPGKKGKPGPPAKAAPAPAKPAPKASDYADDYYEDYYVGFEMIEAREPGNSPAVGVYCRLPRLRVREAAGPGGKRLRDPPVLVFSRFCVTAGLLLEIPGWCSCAAARGGGTHAPSGMGGRGTGLGENGAAQEAGARPAAGRNAKRKIPPGRNNLLSETPVWRPTKEQSEARSPSEGCRGTVGAGPRRRASAGARGAGFRARRRPSSSVHNKKQ